jgi:eukaryotic-like serine/threonine-protein kinase
MIRHNFVVARLFITVLLIGILSIIFNQKHFASGLFGFGDQAPCLANKESPVNTGFLVYQNPEHKIQVQYPASWNKEDQNNKFTSGSSTLYALTTLQPNTPEGFRTTLELEINDISSYPGDLKSLSGMADFEKENILSPEAQILSSNEIQINGCPAHEIVYSQGIPNKEDKWKILETFLVDCNKEYVLRFTATDNNLYDQYIESVQQIVQSYKVTGC